MSSSPGIYHTVSSVVKMTALARSGIQKKDSYQVLDDCGVVGPPGKVNTFHEEYNGIGARVNVSMAPPDDPEKCFAMATEGTILGVRYNTIKWTWSFCERKMLKILSTLHDVVEADEIEQKTLESLSGKLTHYKDIVSSHAKWERAFILYAAENKSKLMPGRWRRGPLQVKVTKELKEQALWWIRALGAAMKQETGIPDVRRWFPSQFLQLYPDAAGGSDTARSNGFGGVIWNPESGPRPMMYGAWPSHIQENRENELGVKFGKKLTMLEAVAALAVLCSEPDQVRNRPCKLYTDNRGLALAYKKAHSRDQYTYTVMMAIRDIAKYLNINLAIVWTPRCSSPGELVADQLSKGKFLAAAETAGCPVGLSRVPRTILKWLEAPRVSRLLGMAILEELVDLGHEVLPREPENVQEVMSLKWSDNRRESAWNRV